MNLVVTFTQPITQRAADCFMSLLSEEVERWGGIRGKKIAQISANPLDQGGRRLHFHVYYEGPPAADREIHGAIRHLLTARKPWGIGPASVEAVGLP